MAISFNEFIVLNIKMVTKEIKNIQRIVVLEGVFLDLEVLLVFSSKLLVCCIPVGLVDIIPGIVFGLDWGFILLGGLDSKLGKGNNFEGHGGRLRVGHQHDHQP